MKRLTIWDIPGEIAVPWDNGNSCDDICKEVGGECERCVINKCFNKLAEYEDFKEEGRLLILPCAPGTTVYKPDLEDGKVYEEYLGGISRIWELDGHFGDTVFFTREEAEAKLKEMEADNGRDCEADN